MTEEVATSLKSGEIRLTKKGLDIALGLGRSMGMSLNFDAVKQFLAGYFAAVDNFHNPDESQRNKNTVILYLLKQAFSNSTPSTTSGKEHTDRH